MDNRVQLQEEKQVYRVQGFTCSGCAGKFERNVKSLPGVRDASVNFGASKLTVYGLATMKELEQAGAFENLKLTSEKQRVIEKKPPFWRSHWNVLVSGLLLLAAYLISEQSGEEGVLPAIVYGLSMVVGGGRLLRQGLHNLIRLQFDMNTLMTVAIIGAAAIGEWGEGATVVILFAISEVLERYSMDKARQSIRALMEIAPKEAMLIRNGEELVVNVDDIVVGDIMLVKPGEKLAMDGVVVRGASTVNQAAITGESIPVSKTIDDEVFAGTLNEEGLLEVRVTKRVEDTAIARMIHLVEEAQAERAPAQAFVDRFAKYYTPAIMILALGIAIFPPILLGSDWASWLYRGLALLVVGCPCALVISTPISIVTAIGNAARNGVLIKGGIHLEEAGRLKAIAFDKTGTLTSGVPVVTDIITFGGLEREESLYIAAALERGSQHPLASAIVRQAIKEGIAASGGVEDFQSITGRGIRANVKGMLYYMGSPKLFEELQVPMKREIEEQVNRLREEAKTVILLGSKSSIQAVLAVADTIRASSREIIQQLHKLGIERTVILTGDHQATAQAIGQQAGVSEVRSELLPKDKLDYMKLLRKEYGAAAMVGDGVNDAPALAAASVGIAMGGAGTDTALETADVALMADDLEKLPYLIRLSRKTLSVIQQNITFSLGIKLLAVALIIPGWLTLWMAIFADMGATLIVTLNSLRLIKVRF